MPMNDRIEVTGTVELESLADRVIDYFEDWGEPDVTGSKFKTQLRQFTGAKIPSESLARVCGYLCDEHQWEFEWVGNELESVTLPEPLWDDSHMPDYTADAVLEVLANADPDWDYSENFEVMTTEHDLDGYESLASGDYLLEVRHQQTPSGPVVKITARPDLNMVGGCDIARHLEKAGYDVCIYQGEPLR